LQHSDDCNCPSDSIINPFPRYLTHSEILAAARPDPKPVIDTTTEYDLGPYDDGSPSATPDPDTTTNPAPSTDPNTAPDIDPLSLPGAEPLDYSDFTTDSDFWADHYTNPDSLPKSGTINLPFPYQH
jgi:hypothetical protein